MTVIGRFATKLIGLATLGLTLAIAASADPGAGADAPLAPKFKANAMSGAEIDFPGAYKGKAVLLVFWATWCPPCRAEVPHLVQAYEAHKGEHFEIVGVSRDKARGKDAATVKQFMEANKMTWEQVYEGTDAISQLYGVRGIPALFLVDGDTGQILASGAALRGDAMEGTLKAAVSAKAAEKKKAGKRK